MTSVDSLKCPSKLGRSTTYSRTPRNTATSDFGNVGSGRRFKSHTIVPDPRDTKSDGMYRQFGGNFFSSVLRPAPNSRTTELGAIIEARASVRATHATS